MDTSRLEIIRQCNPAQNPDKTRYTWDERGMGLLFAEAYRDALRYCPERKTWYAYADGRWQPDAGTLLCAEQIKAFSRLMTLYCAEIEDDSLRQAYTSFVAKMGDRRFRDRIAKDAASVFPISARQFDSKPELINCKNGTYDLQAMRFRKHDWRDFLTMQTNFRYTQTPPQCGRWERFIAEITEGDTDKAEYLQKAAGYAVTGFNREECMFILWGKSTRNGKSTLLNAIQYALGDYGTVAPVSVICTHGTSRNADSATPTLARLAGKRFVTMAESNQYGRLDEETVKQITGGEEISARNLYESPITYLPQFTLWLSCNDLPEVRDKSVFASDRIRLIELNRHFSEAERDETLKDYFRQEDAMQGIFKWLTDGYAMYRQQGLKLPDSMKQSLRKYESSNDVVAQYIISNCSEIPTGSTFITDLYIRYKTFCKENGYYIMNARKFAENIQEKYEVRKDENGRNYAVGLILKQETKQ